MKETSAINRKYEEEEEREKIEEIEEDGEMKSWRASAAAKIMTSIGVSDGGNVIIWRHQAPSKAASNKRNKT